MVDSLIARVGAMARGNAISSGMWTGSEIYP